jgi:tryptophanase
LERVLKEIPVEKIPFVIVTLTCNSSGGQPVSMQNLKEVHEMAHRYGTIVIFDSARFAENAYFIKTREPAYKDKSIKQIVKEMFRYADAMTMSSKKDAIVNMGGFIGFSDRKMYEQASVYNIMFEGFVTYGGMSGRDMNALSQGLMEATEFDYLETRVSQVAYLGEKLKSYGIPLLEPFGGHAIFIDAKQFLPSIPKEQYIAQTLAVEIYLEGGVRAVEIGTLMADRDPDTRANRYPVLEMVRLAIPRRVYTNSHMDYVAAAIANVFERRNEIHKGLKIINEAPILRHFTVELAKIE